MTTGPSSTDSFASTRPLLVALAGAGCSPAVWQRTRHPALDLLAVDWTIGNGPWDLQSIADRLVGALACRRGPTLLAGHSLGGVIAMLAVLSAPEGTVAGLLVADTGASTQGHRDGGLPARVRAGWTPAERDTFLRSCFHRPPPDTFLATAADWLHALDPDIFLQAIDSVRTIDLRHRLRAITVPAVVVQGRFDARRTRSHAVELAEGLANADLVELDTGHTPMIEDAEGFNEAVAMLWRKVARVRPVGIEPPA